MKITVLGAGSGACSAAVDLKLRGFEVVLCSSYSPDIDTVVRSISRRGGLEYSGYLGEGFIEIKTSTKESTCVSDTDVVMIITLASGNEYYARRCSGLFRKEQLVFLNPGYIGCSLNFAKVLKETGRQVPKLCETNNLPYICRLVGPTHVKIFKRSNFLLFSSLPSKDTLESLERARQIYSFLVGARDTLETGMLNPNIVLHPAGMVMNAGWIEASKGHFFYYSDGTTPAIGRVIDAFDRERIAICKAASIRTMKFLDYYKRAGYTSSRAKNIYEAIKLSEPNKKIQAPQSLNHRYLTEDVAYGLVPMSTIAKMAGTLTPITDSLIRLASTLTTIDFWREGMNAERMGVSGFSLSKLRTLINHGNA